MRTTFQTTASALLSILALTTGVAAACSDISDVKMTFYGYPDNSPPGADTAYSCLSRDYTAGGTGTYSNPLTFATAPGEFSQCEIIYAPILKKYLIMQDSCDQCTTDWDDDGEYHIDIWTGSATVNGGDDQINCEDNLTPDGTVTIIRYPASTYSVDTTALYSSGSSPSCRTSHVYPSNSASNYC